MALLTLLAFGCSTVRQPVPPLAGELRPVEGNRVEPDLELWMEGTGPIDPAEAERARAASLDAIEAALAQRGLQATAGDDLLLVRARGVVRTGERKSAQIWSAVGIVVTVVVVVVAAILGSKSHSSPKSAPVRGVVPAPPSRGAPPVHALPRGAIPAPPIPSARPPFPGPYAPEFLPHHAPRPPPFAANLDVWVQIPIGEAPPPPPPVAPPWETPSAWWVQSRGWFDGEELELMLTLVDAPSGAVKWTRTVRGRVDPRDVGEVSGLLGRALEGYPGEQETP